MPISQLHAQADAIGKSKFHADAATRFLVAEVPISAETGSTSLSASQELNRPMPVGRHCITAYRLGQADYGAYRFAAFDDRPMLLAVAFMSMAKLYRRACLVTLNRGAAPDE